MLDILFVLTSYMRWGWRALISAVVVVFEHDFFSGAKNAECWDIRVEGGWAVDDDGGDYFADDVTFYDESLWEAERGDRVE